MIAPIKTLGSALTYSYRGKDFLIRCFRTNTRLTSYERRGRSTCVWRASFARSMMRCAFRLGSVRPVTPGKDGGCVGWRRSMRARRHRRGTSQRRWAAHGAGLGAAAQSREPPGLIGYSPPGHACKLNAHRWEASEHRTYGWTHHQWPRDGSSVAEMQNSSDPTSRLMH